MLLPIHHKPFSVKRVRRVYTPPKALFVPSQSKAAAISGQLLHYKHLRRQNKLSSGSIKRSSAIGRLIRGGNGSVLFVYGWTHVLLFRIRGETLTETKSRDTLSLSGFSP